MEQIVVGLLKMTVPPDQARSLPPLAQWGATLQPGIPFAFCIAAVVTALLTATNLATGERPWAACMHHNILLGEGNATPCAPPQHAGITHCCACLPVRHASWVSVPEQRDVLGCLSSMRGSNRRSRLCAQDALFSLRAQRWARWCWQRTR